MAGGIPRAVRLIASRVGREPGVGVGAGSGRRALESTGPHLRFGSHRQLDMPMTAERRRHGAQRLDTSESTRHPGQPCIEQAAPLGRVYAVARGHRTIFGVLTSHR